MNEIEETTIRRVEDERATAMVQSSLSGLCWDCAIQFYRILHVVHDKMADDRTAYENIYDVKFDGLWIPFGVKDGCKSISSKDETRLQQMLSIIIIGRRLSDDFLIADCRDLEKLSVSDIHVKRFKHQELAQEGKLLLSHTDGSLKIFDLPPSPRGKMSVRGNPEQDGKQKEDALFEEATKNTFGASVTTSYIVILKSIEQCCTASLRSLSSMMSWTLGTVHDPSTWLIR